MLTCRSIFIHEFKNLHSIKILKDEIDSSNISDCCPYFIAMFINNMNCWITTNPYAKDSVQMTEPISYILL